MTAAELAGVRKGLGLTQVQLAQLLGLHPMGVAKWEQGQRDVPAWLPFALTGIRAALDARIPGVYFEVVDGDTGEPQPIATDTLRGARQGLELMRGAVPERQFTITVRFTTE